MIKALHQSNQVNRCRIFYGLIMACDSGLLLRQSLVDLAHCFCFENRVRIFRLCRLVCLWPISFCVNELRGTMRITLRRYSSDFKRSIRGYIHLFLFSLVFLKRVDPSSVCLGLGRRHFDGGNIS